MLWGGAQGGLELRQDGGAVRIAGRFPYNAVTTLFEGGRGVQARKERIASRAFRARIEAGEDVYFLSQHDMDKPLASREAGTLRLEDDDDALSFEARIGADLMDVGHVRDFLGTLRAGLVKGLSPGFRLGRDERSESITTDDGAILRTVHAADLFEVSAVTRGAYPSAQIEARRWDADKVTKFATPRSDVAPVLRRWLL